MIRYNVRKDAGDSPAVEYPGSSLTIPGLAPDLKSLLAAAANGEPLTPIGEPVYDFDEEVDLNTGEFIKKASKEDLENANTRIEVQQLSEAELLHRSEQREEQGSEDAPSTGKPTTTEEPLGNEGEGGSDGEGAC